MICGNISLRHRARRVTIGRGGGIRTPDPLLPKQMRYQTALRPDSCRLYRTPATLLRFGRESYAAKSRDLGTQSILRVPANSRFLDFATLRSE